MKNILLGFYKSESSLFVKEQIIYVYQINPVEAINATTGKCSCFWNIKNFNYCKKTKYYD